MSCAQPLAAGVQREKQTRPSIKEAPANAYGFYAYPLSIPTNSRLTNVWLTSNFIQLCLDRRTDSPVPLCFYLTDSRFSAPPSTEIIRTQTLVQCGLGIDEFLSLQIRGEGYCFLTVDHSKLSDPSLNAHNDHDLLVHGFNLSRGTVDVLAWRDTKVNGRDWDRSFSSGEMTLRSLAAAYHSARRRAEAEIVVWTPRVKYPEYSISPNIILQFLMDYRSGANTSLRFSNIGPVWNRVYGIPAVAEILRSITEVLGRAGRVDPRHTRVLFEHKLLLRRRVSALGLVETDSDLGHWMDELLTISKRLHMLCLGRRPDLSSLHLTQIPTKWVNLELGVTQSLIKAIYRRYDCETSREV